MLFTNYPLEDHVLWKLGSISKVITHRAYDKYSLSNHCAFTEKIFIKKYITTDEPSTLVKEVSDLPYVITSSLIPKEYISFILNSTYGEFCLSGRRPSFSDIQGARIKLATIKDTLIPINEYIDTCALLESIIWKGQTEFETIDNSLERYHMEQA